VEYTLGGMLDLPCIHPPLICILPEELVLHERSSEIQVNLEDLGSGQYTESLGRWQGLVLRDDGRRYYSNA
jgi:hypothetical protein